MKQLLQRMVLGLAVLLSWQVSNGQTRAVSGKVSDAGSSPLPGVSVSVKGTTQGAITDASGKFSVQATNNATLVFSYIGFKAQEIKIGSQSVVDVSMEEDAASLSEVVVVGYGSVRKTDVTGSLTSISSKQLSAVPVQNLSQAMQGRAAGVDVTQTNARPGAAPAIRIRGNRSLNATNDPLFVLDGIPLAPGSSINDFNPNDIESIEILKDASATAIYGSRGANGVILVSSKKGKKGKVQISYDGFGGISQPLAPLEMLSASDFAELRRDGFRGDGSPTNYTTSFPNPVQDRALFTDAIMWENLAKGYEWEDKDKLIPKYRPITEDEKKAMALYGFPATDKVPIYDPSKVGSTDWTGLVLRQGVQQNHQLSFLGGTENMNVSFSLGYFDQKGIQKGQDFTRYSSRLGLDLQAAKWLKIGGSVNLNLNEQDWGANVYGEALAQYKLATPYDANGILIIQPGTDAQVYNPIPKIDGEIDNRRNTRIMASLYAEVQLAKGLRYRANFGPDLQQGRQGNFLTPEASRGTSASYLGRYRQTNRFNFVAENLLFYDKSIGVNHSFSLTALQSIQADRYEFSDIEAADLPYPSQKWYNLGSTVGSGARSFGSDFSQTKLMSWMGRINYSLKNKYLLTATGRYDGSSVLATGKKWDFFPSFAVAWKINEEGFMKDLKAINELKLRVGYGRTGNSAVGAYTTGGRLSKTRYAWDATPAFGFVPSLIPNPDLKWETTGQVDIGLDFGLFNDRVSGSLDVYKANTSNLLMDRQLPTASGFGSIQQNIGSTQNKGIELTLNTINIEQKGGLSWTTNISLAKNKEQITELYGGTNDDIGNRWFIGQPIIAYYDYVVEGVWQINEAEQAAKFYPTDARNALGKPGVGRPKFKDINNDGKIDATNDRQIVGSNVPKLQGGITNSFSYKGFDMSFFFFGRLGQTVLNSYLRPNITGRYAQATFMNDRWTPTNPTNTFPQANWDSEGPVNSDSYIYGDGSFIKLRNVSLGYNFERNVLSKIHLSNLNVYVTATNPLLFTKFKVSDPEFTSSSRTFGDQISGINLTEKSLVFGIRVSL